MKQPASLLSLEKLARPYPGVPAKHSPPRIPEPEALLSPLPSYSETSVPVNPCGTETGPLLALGYPSKRKVSLRAPPRPGLNFLQAWTAMKGMH